MATQTAVLHRLLTPDHVCPFGLRAKDLLVRAGYTVDDRPLTTKEAAAAFKAEHNVTTTPQVVINGELIGGFDALREHLGQSDDTTGDATSYRPIAAIFGVTALMAVATQWNAATTPSLSGWLFQFVAYSMCVLAVLKLRDLEGFANQFITYDLLGMRYLRYAYFYPFAEAFAGIGMLSGRGTALVAIVALLIGGLGAVSVIKAVYIDRRELRCACVGGDSNVPLGAISLTENLMMFGVAVVMLAGLVLA